LRRAPANAQRRAWFAAGDYYSDEYGRGYRFNVLCGDPKIRQGDTAMLYECVRIATL
jgi:hypothetical protein